MQTILVTGGAGYIGSHAVKLLLDSGYRVVVVDNLLRGHRAAVDGRAAFVPLDLLETDRLSALLAEHRVECVMHFAALAYVGESVAKPLMYYHNNVGGTLSLLRAMDRTGVLRMVFSSTCATYGQPPSMPIVETMPQNPINPYGMTKLIAEHMLADHARAQPRFSFTALRYFNVAGCASDGSLGEDHDPESHLIPVGLLAASGRLPGVNVFGADYPTPDGTCIRDYIHVEDLCAAHLLALRNLRDGQTKFYNLGIGRGYSVKQVLDAVVEVTGVKIDIRYGVRREGDPAELFANPALIQRELGWQPRYTDIRPIVATAWQWFSAHPKGYDDRAVAGAWV
jgi:UDP-glucose-4-epimerase GalE